MTHCSLHSFEHVSFLCFFRKKELFVKGFCEFSQLFLSISTRLPKTAASATLDDDIKEGTGSLTSWPFITTHCSSPALKNCPSGWNEQLQQAWKLKIGMWIYYRNFSASTTAVRCMLLQQHVLFSTALICDCSVGAKIDIWRHKNLMTVIEMEARVFIEKGNAGVEHKARV